MYITFRSLFFTLIIHYNTKIQLVRSALESLQDGLLWPKHVARLNIVIF
jgi:hypothetical protein